MAKQKKALRARYANRDDRRIQAQVRRSQAAMLITESASILNSAIRWGFPSTAVVLAAYFLGGRQTGVKIEGIFNAFANQWTYLLIAGLCGGGWAIERRALKRRLVEMAEEKKRLEAVIDPDRSTSGIRVKDVVDKA